MNVQKQLRSKFNKQASNQSLSKASTKASNYFIPANERFQTAYKSQYNTADNKWNDHSVNVKPQGRWFEREQFTSTMAVR